MATKKQNTAFNVQVADFIRNHKKAGTLCLFCLFSFLSLNIGTVV